MAKIIHLILFFYISILFIAYVESCCCSIWFLFTWCNCNPVGCQCTGTRCSYRPWNGGPGATEACRQSDENPCARKSKSKHSSPGDEYALNMYKTLDKNMNGFISMEEMKESKKFLEHLLYSGNSSQEIDAVEIFKSLDLNKDERIEPNEIDDSLEGQEIFPEKDTKKKKNKKAEDKKGKGVVVSPKQVKEKKKLKNSDIN